MIWFPVVKGYLLCHGMILMAHVYSPQYC